MTWRSHVLILAATLGLPACGDPQPKQRRPQRATGAAADPPSSTDTAAEPPSPVLPPTPAPPPDGAHQCIVRVVILKDAPVDGTGTSSTSEAEAEAQARENACSALGVTPQECTDKATVYLHRANFRSSMTWSDGKSTRSFEALIEAAHIDRAAEAIEAGPEPSPAMCVRARQTACHELYGGECPKKGSITEVRLDGELVQGPPGRPGPLFRD